MQPTNPAVCGVACPRRILWSIHEASTCIDGQHVYPEAGCPYSRSTTRSGLPPHLLCTCPRSDGLHPSDFLLDGHVGCSSLQAKYCPFSTGWMARRHSITLSSIVPSRAPIIAAVGSSVIIHQLVSIARKIISCRSEVCRNVYFFAFSEPAVAKPGA